MDCSRFWFVGFGGRSSGFLGGFWWKYGFSSSLGGFCRCFLLLAFGRSFAGSRVSAKESMPFGMVENRLEVGGECHSAFGFVLLVVFC